MTEFNPPPVKLTDFVSEEVPRKQWAVDGIWPSGAKGIIAAPPKNGKSTIAVELAISLATGTPMFNVTRFAGRERARVTYVHQGENSRARIRKDFDLILQARGLGYMEEIYDLNPDPEQQEVIGERFVPAWGEGAPHQEPDLELLVNPGLVLASRAGERQPVVMQHRAWIERYAAERDYLILDPIYMIAGISTNDEAAVIDLMNWLSTVHDKHSCAIVFTHQSSIKRDGGDDPAATVMGSTFIPAWYEAAIFPRCDKKTSVFRFQMDNLREMGEVSEVTLAGLGVGRWFYTANAQDVHDSRGRASPQAAGKQVRLDQMRSILEEEPQISDADLAERLGVGDRSVRSYRKDLASNGEMV